MSLRKSEDLARPVLEARDVTKSYGHVRALRGVSFKAYAGEVVAMVGDNGAGKSTFVRILSGAAKPDSGQILIDGEAVSFDSAADAQRAGIETVYQDLALAPDLGAAGNLFLGREVCRRGILGWFGMLDQRQMHGRAVETFRSLGTDLPSVELPVGGMSGGQQQIVAASRAAMWATRVIFLDEPTAALGVRQTERIEDLVRRLAYDRGIAVVLISHNMPQVLSLADRIEVLRLGESVTQFRRGEAEVNDLVAAITGAASAKDREGAR
jgi:simple sugar transport system ATP-binding protein